MKPAKVVIWLAMCVVGLFDPTEVDARKRWPASCRMGPYELQVMVEGVTRPDYCFYGRSYIEGRLGERYVLRVHNRSRRRVEAVISVDRRDVIDGRLAGLSRRGYVILPHSFIDVDGFRISLDEVAAFRFSRVPDSYTAKLGTPWNVGVMEVAIFPERRRLVRPLPPRVYPLEKRSPSRGGQDRAEGPTTAWQIPSDSPNLGTRFGERRTSLVTQTRFVRENWSYPAARLSMRYDDRQGLCRMGLVFFCTSAWYTRYPSTPRDFAKPPPGWEHFSPWY